MYVREFRALLLFYFSYIFFVTFSRSLLPTYFLKEGFSFKEIVASGGIIFLAQLICLFIFKKPSLLIAWRFSLIAWLIFILLVVRLENHLQFYLAMIANGISIFLFFIVYNVIHFDYTPQNRRGESTAVMVAFGPIISIIAPFAAGILAQIKFSLVWLVSGIVFIFCYYLTFLQKDFSYEYSIKKALSYVAATRIYVFLEGIWEAMVFAVIPVYTLFFINTPLNYGIFASYLALLGAISSFILGKFTDKIQKRAVFLYPVTVIMAVVTYLFPFATESLNLWIILTGAISFLLPIFWNLTIAMVVDTHQDLKLAMPGREVFLSSGRTLGILIAFISFSLEKSPQIIFLVLGSVLLLFPIALYWNTRIKKHYQYL
ncbi:MFS transporter [Candidatus Curtissbacteria bacterium]|nr:MFS transporter [Candidatus Curtissbacteria bacterium]